MTTELRDFRIAHRERRPPHGRLVSTIAPDQVHGRSQGYMAFGCHCDPCQNWYSDFSAVARERKRHNDRILANLRAGIQTKIESPCTEGPVKPVRKRKVQAQPQPVVKSYTEPVEPVVVPSVQIVEETPQLDVSKIEIGSKVTHQPPPVTRAIREQIKTIAQFEDVSQAYYNPDWRAPLPNGRERRAYGNISIIVGENTDKSVIWLGEREVADGKPELLTTASKAVPKAKGGRGGSTKPTDQKALIEILKRQGCTVTHSGGGHLQVSKDGKTLTLPSTPSDYRSLLNSIRDARKVGLM